MYFLRTLAGFVFLLMSLLLVACTPEQAKQIEKHWEDQPKISFYPYLYTKQFTFLSRQNIVGVAPGFLIVPLHQDTDLELQMNAESWWGISPEEIRFANYFIAEQSRRVLGCGPLKAGRFFKIQQGVYTFKREKVILSHDLTWRLKYNIPSICRTATDLPIDYFKEESPYWDVPFSQNRIYP